MRHVEISHLIILIDRADGVVLAEEIPIRDIDRVHAAVRERLDSRKGVLMRVMHVRVRVHRRGAT